MADETVVVKLCDDCEVDVQSSALFREGGIPVRITKKGTTIGSKLGELIEAHEKAREDDYNARLMAQMTRISQPFLMKDGKTLVAAADVRGGLPKGVESVDDYIQALAIQQLGEFKKIFIVERPGASPKKEKKE